MQKARNFIKEYEAKKRVYHALILRFVISRHGRENIGFMWTVVEPMLLCLGVMLIWSLTKAYNYHSVNIIAFVFTGYMPLTLWRHQTGHVINIGKTTKFMTVFRNLHVLDALISLLILEFISVTLASIFVFCFLYVLGVMQFPYELSGVLLGWLAMGAVCTSAGILFASLSEISNLVEKFNGPVQYFMLPFSGCFFMVDWLPSSTQQIAVYLPLVSAYELIRGGYFGPEVNTYGSASYVLGCSIIVAGIGLALFRLIKDKIDA